MFDNQSDSSADPIFNAPSRFVTGVRGYSPYYGAPPPSLKVGCAETELSMILGISAAAVRQYVREIETETGRPLSLKGYKMDQGSRLTHKGEIIRLYEQGIEAPDIARQTHHSLKSVERYSHPFSFVQGQKPKIKV